MSMSFSTNQSRWNKRPRLRHHQRRAKAVSTKRLCRTPNDSERLLLGHIVSIAQLAVSQSRPRPSSTLASSNATRYHPMIKSFRDRNTFRLFSREHVAAFPESLHRVMLRKLVALDVAATLEDLRIPAGNRLAKLKGKRLGQHSIRVNDRWR